MSNDDDRPSPEPPGRSSKRKARPDGAHTPHLVYLRLTLPADLGKTTTYAAVTLRAPKKTRGAHVDFCCPWPLELKDGPEAERLTETVAHLPGFERLRTGFRIAPDAPLSEENLRTLGDVLLKLATHYSQECL